MWNRKELKSLARRSLRENYISMVSVGIMLALFTSLYWSSFLGRSEPKEVTVNNAPVTNTEIVNTLMAGRSGSETIDIMERAFGGTPPTRGILAGVFNNITKSGSFIFGILNAFNQFLFKDQIMAGIIILIGSFFSLFYLLFIQSIILVGGMRFFLENRLYTQTSFSRVLYLIKTRKILRPSLTLLRTTLYTILWYFTLVGGVYKYYSYRMVPFLLAENPTIPSKEAIRLSISMMKGNKWRLFLLDCSFLPWKLLALATGGVFGFLFANPYKTASEANLYAALRQNLLDKTPAATHYLKDAALFSVPAGQVSSRYPTAYSPFPESTGTLWHTDDYDRRYSIQSYVLLFFSFAFAGWLWEVCIELFGKGIFVNRGVLSGPWLPIYGTGALLVVLFLRRWAAKPWLVFLLVMVLAGGVEYFASWALESLYHQRWWEYTDYFLNINGRVCLEGLLVFGLGGCLALYLVAPMLDNLYKLLPPKPKNILCIALVVLFAADIAFSYFSPNTGAEITMPLAVVLPFSRLFF